MWRNTLLQSVVCGLPLGLMMNSTGGRTASRGGGDIKARSTSRGAHDASHDDQGQAGARRAPASAVSLFPLGAKGQAQARGTDATSKGFHIGATIPRLAGRLDGGHRGSQDGVIASAFGNRRPPLVRIACTGCPPSNPAIVESLPTQYLVKGPRPL